MKTVVVELGVNRPVYVRGAIEKYKDIMFYGFEPCPHPGMVKPLEDLEKEFSNFKFSKMAAWIKDEVRVMTVSGSKCVGSSIVDKSPTNGHIAGFVPVQCTDLDAWVKATLVPEDNNILRADIEGSEYYLFPHMMEKGSMAYFSTVFYEHHDLKMMDREKAKRTSQEMLGWFAQNKIYVSTAYKELFDLEDVKSYR